MKIAITYTDSEERKARIIQQIASAMFDGAEVRKSDRHPPFKHIYFATKRPEKPPQNRVTP